MLELLPSHRVTSLEELIPLIGTEWTVFHFPPHKGSKPALYGRMWKIRALGIDAMVRELASEYVLIARREHEEGKDMRMP
jgi:hypothetical protein